MAKILFVDDENHRAQPYLDELKLAGYDAVLTTETDEALAYVQQNPDINVLILDIMMPAGVKFAARTDQGLDTGVILYDEIRKIAPDLPVIVLTNVSDRDVAQKFRNESNCWYYPKINLLAVELPDEVKEILEESLRQHQD
jgi:CheY-like chemotaxis protein